MSQPSSTQVSNELLALVSEECAESIHMAQKALRHGLMSSHADYGGKTNEELLEKELGQVLAAIELLVDAGVLTRRGLLRAQMQKLLKLPSYLHSAKVPPHLVGQVRTMLEALDPTPITQEPGLYKISWTSDSGAVRTSVGQVRLSPDGVTRRLFLPGTVAPCHPPMDAVWEKIG